MDGVLEEVAEDLRMRYAAVYVMVDRIKAQPGWLPNWQIFRLAPKDRKVYRDSHRTHFNE